jgi:hypothetical protein
MRTEFDLSLRREGAACRAAPAARPAAATRSERRPTERAKRARPQGTMTVTSFDAGPVPPPFTARTLT